jgi:hypothetical protein
MRASVFRFGTLKIMQGKEMRKDDVGWLIPSCADVMLSEETVES